MIDRIQLLLQAICFVYLSLLFGKLILRSLAITFSQRSVEASYEIILGYGAFAILGLFLGVIGILHASVLWAIGFILLLLNYKTVIAHIESIGDMPRMAIETVQNIRKSSGRSTLALYICVLVWLIANFSLAFVPITAHDTLFYHLPIIETIAREGQITFGGNAEHYSYHLILGEILFAMPKVLFQEHDQPFVFGFVQWSVLPLFLILAHALIKRRLRHPFFAPTALIMILGIMNMQREILHFGYIDVLVYLFGFGAIFYIINKLETRSSMSMREGVFLGILIGLSISVKFLGLYFLLFAFIGLLVLVIRAGMSVRATKTMLTFMTVCALVGGFWYIKNLHLFGNPLYPMYAYEGYSEGIGLFMLERTMPNMIVFPFYRWGVHWFMHPEKESSSDLVVFAYLAAFYLLLAISLFVRKKAWRPVEIALIVFTQGYLWLLFYGSHQARFLIPAIMVLPCIIILMTDKLYKRVLEQHKSWQQPLLKLSFTFALLAFVVLFAGNVHYFKVRFDYIFGILSEPEYILKIGSQ